MKSSWVRTLIKSSQRKKDEPWHDETNKVTVCPAKTQISLGIRPVWSESSLSTWGKLGSLATYSVHNEDSDQTVRMPRLIWVFAGCTLTLLVLSCHGSDSKDRKFPTNAVLVVSVYRDPRNALWQGGPPLCPKLPPSGPKMSFWAPS